MSCINDYRICLASIFLFQSNFTYSAQLRDERKIKTTPTYQCLCSSPDIRMTFSLDGTLVLAPCVGINTNLNNDVAKSLRGFAENGVLKLELMRFRRFHVIE